VCSEIRESSGCVEASVRTVRNTSIPWCAGP
jgi:hypothetical protein